MRITRDQLLTADWQTLFTRDPTTFFEAVLINILWDKSPASIDHKLIARQRLVFEQWFKYFETNLRRDIEAELGAEKQAAHELWRQGSIAGQIHALTNLPIKHGVLGKSVDLTKVASELKRLKAVEPRGVNNHGQQPQN